MPSGAEGGCGGASYRTGAREIVAGSVVEGSAAGGCGGRGEGDRRGGAMPDSASLRA